MWPERFCLSCGTQLTAQKRADAFFCTERHEAAWRKARKLVRTSALLADLEKQLTEHSPKQACWYRLMLLAEGASWIYPALSRPAVRFDGRQRQTFGFHLRPYEPPLVPRRGQYTLMLYDALGQQVPTPSFVSTVYAEPIHLISLDSSDHL